VPSPDASDSLTLADFESMALANNPTLVQATARVQAAQGRWVQGGLRPNPIVGYQASEVGNNGTAGQQGAFLSQEFVRGGKLALNRVAANQEIAQLQQEMEAQRLRVLNDVRIQYFNVLVAQRALEMSRDLVDIGKRGLETTEQLFKGQQVSNAEVLQARIESATATITLQNAKNRHVAAWRRLSSVVGTSEMAPQEVSGDLTSQLSALDWGEAYARLITQSPELASARAGVNRARAVLERAQAEPIPNLDVQIGIQYDNSSQYTIGNIQAGVPIPVSNRNQGNVQTAYADLRNAQAEIARIELSLRNRLATAYENYANARNQVDTFFRQILPDARSSLDLVSTGYRQGQVSFLVLLTAQRTNAQANLAYLQALKELNANRIAIEGLLLTGSLQSEQGSIDAPRLTEGIAPVFGPGRPPVERN
jgi:cobalt-zinc-cadmium efflux system outer membrane protein